MSNIRGTGGREKVKGNRRQVKKMWGNRKNGRMIQGYGRQGNDMGGEWEAGSSQRE